MKNRIFAWILCVSMVLGMLPGMVMLPAKADTTGTLSVDKDGKALCPVCNETVTWTPFAGNAAGTQKMGEFKDGKHHHYYLSADVNAKNIDVYFLQLTASTKMCFHLNGHDLYHGGYIMAGGGTVLNILGSGNVIFTATNTSSLGYDQSGLYANVGSSLTLYGGNYSVAEEALETGKPTLQVRDTGAGKAFIKNAVVQGKAYVAGGTLTLEEGAQVEQIQVDAPGKLYVKSNWTGSAAVSFAAELQNNAIPAANGGCEGAFTGKLQINQGAALTGTADGTLTATGVNADLVLDADSKAFCYVCNDTVTWTAISTGDKKGIIQDNAHHHFYLTKDIDARKINGQYLDLRGTSTKACLHLNGHDLYYGGYIMAGGATVLNIMGSGKTVFTSTNVSPDGYDACGLYANSGTINIYGGTHSNAEDALTEGRPTAITRTGAMSIKNALVTGFIDSPGGTVNLEETAQVEQIRSSNGQLSTGQKTYGKVYVKRNWTGSAKVTFAAALENHVVPAANGGAEGQFAGKLTLPNGNKLQANASGRLVETGLNACLVPDANSKALCEACHKVVTWTAFAGNDAGTANLGHRDTAGAHYHYYLSADANAKNIKEYFMNLMKGSFCLHLNGHDLYHGGYVLVANGAVLNVMGSGNMVFTATNNGGFDQAGLFMRGIITLYGGTYDVALDALEEGIPTIVQDGGSARILDGVSVKGLTEIRKGSVTLEDSAKLENVQVDTTLTLKDSATVTGNVGLRTASATVQGPEGLNVTTTAGDTVLYSAGKYTVHNHAFDRQNTDGKYLKDAATCASPAIYYKSCACGEKTLDATFEYGTKLEHSYTGENGVCVNGCGKTVCQNDGHAWGEEIEAKAATCMEKGNIAYYDCANCELYAVGEEKTVTAWDQIEIAVDASAHKYGNWVEVDETTHKRVCAYNAEHVETADHVYQNGVCVCGKEEPEDKGAQVGDQKFDTLQEALEAVAESGGEVKLLKETVVEGSLRIPNKVTLDLAGQKLTVSGEEAYVLACYTDSFITDSSDDNSGRLDAEISQLRLLENNSYLPVKMADGIMFVEATSGNQKKAEKNYQCWIDSADAALINALKAGKASELALEFQVAITWGNNVLKYTFKDETVTEYMKNWQTHAMFLKITGAEGIADLKYQARIVFADDTKGEVVVWAGDVVNHS